MVFIVSAIFGICWATDVIMHFLMSFGSYKLGRYAIPVAHTMIMFNAAVNPFAYALISQQYRAKMKEILFGAICSTSARISPPRNPKVVGTTNLTSQPIDGRSRTDSTEGSTSG